MIQLWRSTRLTAAALLFLSFTPQAAASSQEAALSVRVTDDRTYVAPSSTVTYTVTVSNDGDEGATSVETELTLGAGLIFESCSGGCTGGGTRGAWPAFNLAAGAKRVFTLTAKVPAAATPGTRYQAKATADAPGTIADATDESFVGQAQLSVSKTDEKQDAVRGDTLTYTIVATNPGTLPIDDVVITDDLKGGPEFVSADRGGVFDATSRTVTWPPVDLKPGAKEEFTVTAKVPLTASSGQILKNAATATGGGLKDSVVDETLVTLATGLALTKSDDRADADPGEELTYTITVRNTGEVDEPKITLVDRFGERLELVSLPTGGTYADREVSWPEFALAAGEKRSFTVVARILAEGEQDLVKNTVTATTPAGTRGSAQDVTRLLMAPYAKIGAAPAFDEVASGAGRPRKDKPCVDTPGKGAPDDGSPDDGVPCEDRPGKEPSTEPKPSRSAIAAGPGEGLPFTGAKVLPFAAAAAAFLTAGVLTLLTLRRRRNT